MKTYFRNTFAVLIGFSLCATGLIADDDPDFREVLRSIFDPWFALLEAVSGEQVGTVIASKSTIQTG